MLGSAKTNWPLLTLTSWVKGTSSFDHQDHPDHLDHLDHLDLQTNLTDWPPRPTEPLWQPWMIKRFIMKINAIFALFTVGGLCSLKLWILDICHNHTALARPIWLIAWRTTKTCGGLWSWPSQWIQLCIDFIQLNVNNEKTEVSPLKFIP